jgi:hypothetical protein
MGADLLITALIIERDRTPDFGAAHTAIDSISAEQVEFPDEFWDHDPDTDVGLGAIREELHDSLAELEAALEWNRELTSLELRGATVYLTGGLSNGDAPTELFETFSRLWAVPTVLAAAGFEVAP